MGLCLWSVHNHISGSFLIWNIFLSDVISFLTWYIIFSSDRWTRCLILTHQLTVLAYRHSSVWNKIIYNQKNHPCCKFWANYAHTITKPLYYRQDNLLWWSPPAFWCALQWSARRSRTCVLQVDNLNAKKRGYEGPDSCCCLTVHL